MKFGIHWFRRDLRVQDNAALQRNRELNNGKVLGLFCFDSKFLSREDFSSNRFAFFIKTLRELKNDFQKAGGDFLILDLLPLEAFKKILNSQTNFTLSFNRDYEPFARKRDREIVKFLENKNIEVIHQRDHLLIEPTELYKSLKDRSTYQIFTPFSKKWMEAFKTKEVQDRLKILTGVEPSKGWLKGKWEEVGSFTDSLDAFEAENLKKVTIEIPQAGYKAAFKKLQTFKPKLSSYKEQRDIPSEQGTSQLSIFLKNGSLTIPQIIKTLGLSTLEGSTGTYLKELIWREFYYYILWHHPRVETEAFIEKYKDLKWENNKKLFQAWCDGKTGYPIIDAGMRQLKQTGWMHNRVRMIVASFLTKDLLIDWRWGENYFMKMLLDGDLAPNNGGWQWAASTGCDAQPYFRIFNPWLQAKKFDPDGSYIKKWVPELINLNPKELHNPETFEGKLIVEHDEQKEKALKLYKLIKNTR